MAITSAHIGIGSSLLLRSVQTGELLKVKLTKSERVPQKGYNENKKGLQRIDVGDEENGLLRLSDASPLGRALLGKARGEIATVEAPAGIFTWEIIEIFNGR